MDRTTQRLYTHINANSSFSLSYSSFVYTKAQDGACIEFYFEKNRAVFGDDVKPFEARLESNTNDDGIKTLSWTCKSLEDSTFDTVCALANEGLGNSEIAQELEIHKSTVSRYVKRGKEGISR